MNSGCDAAPRSPAACAPIVGEQVLDEQRDVARALAQRRQHDLHDREPEVEVRAERAAVDLGAQVAVGRRDDAHVAAGSCRVRRRGGSRATRARAGAWAGARAAARRSRRGTACRPSASSNAPIRRSVAPVNAPSSWPNSSDSSRFAGIAPQSTTTNGPFARALAVVDRLGGALLAGAGLALEQHGRVARRDLLEQREHRAHHRARADERAERRAVGRRELGLAVVDVEAELGVAERERVPPGDRSRR